MVTREIKCRYCQGYGFIRADKNCPVCGGTGKVTQTDLEIGKNFQMPLKEFLTLS